MAASVINLVMIATDRYIAVEKPFLYEELFSKKRALMIILTGWFLAILITLLPLTWQFVPSLTEQKKQLINVIYAGTIFSFTLLCGLLLFIFYRKIVQTVRTKVLFHKPQKPSNSAGVNVCIISTTVFFVSWIIYSITEILLQCEINIPEEIVDGSYFVLMIGPCLDPVLYAYYRRDFRGCLSVWWQEKWTPLMTFYNGIVGRTVSSDDVLCQ